MRSLAALVPATVEGILRDVSLASATGVPGLERIADHAGCALIEAADIRAALLQALAATRETNVLLLRAGCAPEAGFGEELSELIGDGHRLARLRERPDGFLTRLFPALAPAAAVLAPRERLAQIAAADFAAISRALGRAPTLRCRARRVD